MKLVYIVGGAIAVIAWIALGMVIAKGPQPEIVVPAEALWKIGFFNITNTMFTAWVVMATLIIASLVATRSMKLMPGGFQNFVEASIGFLVDQVADIAGEKNGRRFFMVIATFFLFIVASNWMGLLPFFNAIGKTDDVGHEIFHELFSAEPEKLKLKDGVYEEDKKFTGFRMDDAGGMVVVKPGGKSVEFEVYKGDTPEQALNRYVVVLAHTFAGFTATEEEIKHPSDAMVKEAAAALASSDKAPQLITAAAEGGHEGDGGMESAALGATIHGIDFEKSQKIALVVPFFRGVYSDVNNTLALGICSFLIVEFWGFQSLGLGYLKKFINFSSPINAFVGFLELLSEFIRIVSFTFRLFGNIFAGEVLILMLTFLMPFLFVDIIYGLELFVGFIQAAVFALLTLVFATMAVEHHGEEEHHEGHHDEDSSADAHHHAGAAQAH